MKLLIQSNCFDPDDSQTLIETDTEVLEQFMEFEKALDGCLSGEDAMPEKKSLSGSFAWNSMLKRCLIAILPWMIITLL